MLPTLTRLAEAFIGEWDRNKPNFLYFPLPAPHTPILPTAEFQGKSGTNEYGDFCLQVDDVVGRVMAAVERKGKVTVHVRPEDIILSKERVDSSARNVFKGEVTGISDFGGTVRLNVDAGKTFVVQITKRSFEEMELNIGSRVYLTFKASSVRII